MNDTQVLITIPLRQTFTLPTAHGSRELRQQQQALPSSYLRWAGSGGDRGEMLAPQQNNGSFCKPDLVTASKSGQQALPKLRGSWRRVTEWITITGTVLIKTETECGNREWNPQLGHYGWSTGQVLAQVRALDPFHATCWLSHCSLGKREKKPKTSRKQKVRPFFPSITR